MVEDRVADLQLGDRAALVVFHPRIKALQLLGEVVQDPAVAFPWLGWFGTKRERPNKTKQNKT